VKLNDPKFAKLFYSPSLDAFLNDGSWNLRSSVSRQMALTNFNESYKEGSNYLNDFMIYLLITGIVIYLFSYEKQAMRFMFVMMRTLQIIMHLPIMHIIFPANVITLFSALIPTLSFDILDAFMDW